MNNQKIEIALTPEQMVVVLQAVGETPSRLGGALLVQLDKAFKDFQREQMKDPPSSKK